MSNFVSGWYLLYTKPRREKKVADRLSEESIMFYLPTVNILRNWNDRKKMVEAPLFPSYVFIYLQQLQDYYKGLDVEGVLQYVKFGKQIAKVSEDTVSNLKILISRGKYLEVSSDYFEPSKKLLIKEGPLSGLTCEVVQHKNREKILVRVNLLNRVILMDMPISHLTASHFPPAIIT
ncbi:transcription termination/antitermination protein NusG [Chitinophaga japonensis]|uniref:Transcription antitermination factor NusG n=1 Tax=Chitinophaga japonensis TaxID=104662 RepID=A0A562SLC5_CHIJA|nr:UpxY family transcription antiterminator [Chitinophaga japonensis]TWI81953.1 transcription antitermination factor NusG [Chitinophaga japonensis]